MDLLFAAIPLLTAFSEGKLVYLNCTGAFRNGRSIPVMRVVLNESVSTIKLSVESEGNTSDWVKADYKSDAITTTYQWKSDTIGFRLNRINGKFQMNEVQDGFDVKGECSVDSRIRKF